jgi:hypothetical protein
MLDFKIPIGAHASVKLGQGSALAGVKEKLRPTVRGYIALFTTICTDFRQKVVSCKVQI